MVAAEHLARQPHVLERASHVFEVSHRFANLSLVAIMTDRVDVNAACLEGIQDGLNG